LPKACRKRAESVPDVPEAAAAAALWELRIEIGLNAREHPTATEPAALQSSKPSVTTLETRCPSF
jgi:hypothetical protein